MPPNEPYEAFTVENGKIVKKSLEPPTFDQVQDKKLIESLSTKEKILAALQKGTRDDPNYLRKENQSNAKRSRDTQPKQENKSDSSDSE